MRKVLLSAAALFLPLSVLAASAGGGAPTRVDNLVPTLCRGRAESFLGPNASVRAMFGEKGIDTEMVCSCASDRFLKDREISRVATQSLDELFQQPGVTLKFDTVTSYLTMRSIQHILQCLSEEMDRKLADFTLPVAAANALPAGSARDFADSMVPLVIRGDAAAIHQSLPPASRSSLSSDRIAGVIATLRSTFGKIETAEYWRHGPAVKVTAGRQIPIQQVWYRITTDRFAADHALVLELVEEAGRHWLLGFSIMRNLGKMPAGERPPVPSSQPTTG